MGKDNTHQPLSLPELKKPNPLELRMEFKSLVLPNQSEHHSLDVVRL